MLAVENLNLEAVSFDFRHFDFKNFGSEVGNWTIAAGKMNLNFAAENVDMSVVVAYMNFGSDSVIEVFDELVEVSEFSIITAEAASKTSSIISSGRIRVLTTVLRKRAPMRLLSLIFLKIVELVR